MKNTMLFSGLLTVLCSSIYAQSPDPLILAALENYGQVAANSITLDATAQSTNMFDTLELASASTTTTTIQKQATVPETTTTTTTPTTSTVTVPATTTTTAPVTTTPAPTTTTVITNNPPPATTTTTTATVPAPGSATTMAQPMNCTYHIPAETTHVEHAIIMQWAENATRQSFDFDHVNINQQLASLKPCYTEQGWQSFNDALNKSGNLSAIQTQRLMVSSVIDGNLTVTDIKDNQWRVSVPLQVVYQNEKQKLTQLLTVDLVIGRKISGDLGIMQMIASPRQAVTTTPTTTKPTTVIIKQPADVAP